MRVLILFLLFTFLLSCKSKEPKFVFIIEKNIGSINKNMPIILNEIKIGEINDFYIKSGNLYGNAWIDSKYSNYTYNFCLEQNLIDKNNIKAKIIKENNFIKTTDTVRLIPCQNSFYNTENKDILIKMLAINELLEKEGKLDSTRLDSIYLRLKEEGKYPKNVDSLMLSLVINFISKTNELMSKKQIK